MTEVQKHAHTHTHMHTHTCARTHIRTHIRTHTRRHIRTHTHRRSADDSCYVVLEPLLRRIVPCLSLWMKAFLVEISWALFWSRRCDYNIRNECWGQNNVKGVSFPPDRETSSS